MANCMYIIRAYFICYFDLNISSYGFFLLKLLNFVTKIENKQKDEKPHIVSVYWANITFGKECPYMTHRINLLADLDLVGYLRRVPW